MHFIKCILTSSSLELSQFLSHFDEQTSEREVFTKNLKILLKII